MLKNTSCLLGFALAAGFTMIASPSQAQTIAEINPGTTSSQLSTKSQKIISILKKSSDINQNQNQVTKIVQAQPEDSSETTKNKEPEEERNWVYSRIGFGLKQ